NPDFVKLAEAHGCPGIKVTKTDQVEDALRHALEHKDGPILVEFVVEKEDNVYPMVPAGQSVHEMIDTPEPLEAGETEGEPIVTLEKGKNVQQRSTDANPTPAATNAQQA
ncbi:MAG: thiamine pyrophosphate-dependent enzyme, partial [Bacteroidota bacterium]